MPHSQSLPSYQGIHLMVIMEDLAHSRSMRDYSVPLTSVDSSVVFPADFYYRWFLWDRFIELPLQLQVDFRECALLKIAAKSTVCFHYSWLRFDFWGAASLAWKIPRGLRLPKSAESSFSLGLASASLRTTCIYYFWARPWFRFWCSCFCSWSWRTSG